MKKSTNIAALVAVAFLSSCASSSAYMGVLSSTYDGGMQDTATGGQSGGEIGVLIGDGLVVGDVGFRAASGSANTTNGSELNTDQFALSAGGRLYASRDWIVEPYVGAGVAAQRHEFENGYQESDSFAGLYLRLGADVRLSDCLALTVAWETIDNGSAEVGDRRAHLDESALLFGISVDL